MKLYIIRHAHSVGNDLNIADSISPEFDLGLSEKGKIQAEEIVSTLNAYQFDVIIVSPLKRTIDTITPYLNKLTNSKSNPVIIVNTLTLERNIGEFTGMKMGSMLEYCKQHGITDNVSFRPKGGESILDAYERAKLFLIYLQKTFKDESVLVCGHKNFLTCLEIAITKENIMDFYSKKELFNGEIREFDI